MPYFYDAGPLIKTITQDGGCPDIAIAMESIILEEE
jgi:hypothetical protein